MSEGSRRACVVVLTAVLVAAAMGLGFDAGTVKVLEGHTDAVSDVSVTPDGRFVVSGSSDRTLRVWLTATAEAQAVLNAHTGWIRPVIVTPDGGHIASGGHDRSVIIWRAPPW